MFSKANAFSPRGGMRAAASPQSSDFGLAGVLVSGLRSLFHARSVVAQAPTLSLEARLSLGGTRAALLVACHGHRYLLGTSADSLFLIGEVTASAQAEGEREMQEAQPSC